MSSNATASPTGDPWLLTPGPLTTSVGVKQAMLHDFGSRDDRFIALNRRIRQRLRDIVNGGDDYTCVPLQGSGTFAVEAMLATLVPRAGKVLILINGAYGKRMAKICDYLGRRYQTQDCPEDMPVDCAQLDSRLQADPAVTHVAVVHCETTSGIRNPLEQIAEVVQKHQRRLLIDAMSAFGALPLDARRLMFEAVVASSNKCLEGVPGLGFCLVRKDALSAAAGNAHSLSLDLHDQWTSMERNGQWRFTPPTHCLLALNQALDEFDAEGGVSGRGARYAANCALLTAGMRELGFRPLLPESLQAPIIVTFHTPADPKFHFERFYDSLRRRGYVIYPGKLTVADSFRIGCIGRVGSAQMQGVLDAVRATLSELGVTDTSPLNTV